MLCAYVTVSLIAQNTGEHWSQLPAFKCQLLSSLALQSPRKVYNFYKPQYSQQ